MSGVRWLKKLVDDTCVCVLRKPLHRASLKTVDASNNKFEEGFCSVTFRSAESLCLESLLYLREFPSPKLQKITRIDYEGFFLLFGASVTCCWTTRKTKNKNLRESSEFLVVLFYHLVGSIWWVIRSPEGEEIRVFQHKPSHK